LLTTNCGFETDLGSGADGERGEAGHGGQHDHLAAGRLERAHLRADVRVARHVGLLGRDRAEDLLDAGQAVPAEVVVLAEEADLLAGVRLLDVGRQDLALDRVVRVEAERARILVRLVPAAAAAGHEEVRHPVGLEEVEHAGVRRGAQAVQDREHLVLQHELRTTCWVFAGL
jgi:hypothetical protein